jgi:lysophospholipase L1-like esterase
VVSPSGDLVSAKTAHTSGASFSGTGAGGNWNLSSTFAPAATSVQKWQPNTAYAAGQQVVSPNGDVVSAISSFTSAGSYSAANWNLSTTFARDSSYVPSDYSKLLPFYAALANRNEARCTIALMGDSITEGAYCTNLSTATTAARLNQSLRARFPTLGVTGGRGWIPAANSAPSTTGIVTASAGVTNSTAWGPGWQYASLTSATTTLTVSLTGTSFDIMYLTGSGFGVGYYTIDGGSPVTFNTNAATTDGTIVHVTMTAGTHTIVIGWSSGGQVDIDGIVEYNGDESAGISVARLGYSGSSASQWNTSLWWNISMAALAPSLIVLQFGVNDANASGGNRTAAQFKSDLTSMIANARVHFTTPPPIILSMMYQTSETYVEPWQNYVTAAKQIAAADAAVIVVDHSARMPATTAANTYGLYSTDNVHPSDKGYAMIAETLASVLTPR